MKAIFQFPTLIGLTMGVAFTAVFSNQSKAGIVITANLPANTAIINISGTADGAANSAGSDQAFWYEPFNTGGAGDLLIYTVQPGTYGFRVVDPTDAAQLYPTLTSGQLGEIYTAWTFNSPWVTDYLVFNSSAATNTTEQQLFDGAFSNTNGVDWTTYSDAVNAYDAAITNGFYNLIRPGAAGRSGTNYSTSYTFTIAQSLIFVIPDYDLGDNSGGVSVLVSPVATPQAILSISQTRSNMVTLQWPTNAPGYYLESDTNPLSLAWNQVTNATTIQGTNFSVTTPIGVKMQVFRLHLY